MKKNNKNKTIAEARPQTAAPTKSKKKNGKYQPAIKNNVTDSVTQTAAQTAGRNQSKTKRQDLLPLD